MKIKQFLHHLNLRSTHLFPKLNKTTKVILTICLVFCVSLYVKSTFATSSINVDMTDVLQQYSQKQDAIEKGNNQESWIDQSIISNATSLTKASVGKLPSSTAEINNWTPKGIIGFTNQAIAYLYTPPASGVQYIASSINSFLGKPTYAADNGFGFNKLSGILTMWKTTRNAVYTLISLFFVVTGIMIMLRVKISPQATVTIQSAIPGIVSSLILVTFSYAIAGLLIDASNIVLGVVLSLIDSGYSLSSNIGKSIKELMSLDIFGFSSLIGGQLFSSTATIAVTAIGGITGGIVGLWLLASVASQPVMGILTFVILLLIVVVYIAIQMIKLFIGLAKCYVNIIIQVILGPIQIGMGAIPGSKVNFSTWFNNLIAQIAVFPATTIFLVFSIFLTKTLEKSDTSLWSPTLFGAGGFIAFIVGIACLSILSKIPDIVPEFIFGIKPSPVIAKALDTGNLAKTVGGFAKSVTTGIAEQEITGQWKTKVINPRILKKAGRDVENEKNKGLTSTDGKSIPHEEE